MKSYAEGHRLPQFTLKEVVNINHVGQSAQPWICNNVVFGDC